MTSGPVAAIGVESRLAGAFEKPQSPRLLIVILNFNGLADTLTCLESLKRQTTHGFDVLVIDNGSRSDELAAVAARFPDVECRALPVNQGWAGGNNVGLRLAAERGFDHVCLLNNDTILDPDAIASLLAAAAMLDGPCLLHPSIAYADEPARYQLFPELANDADAHARVLAETADLVEMSFAYGACLLLPVSLVDHLGLLDERFFLQLEESDYFHRARAIGIRSFCARRARILHRESVSFAGRMTPDKLYYLVRNSFLLAEKHTHGLRDYLRAGRALSWAIFQAARTSTAEEYGTACVQSWTSLLRWGCSGQPLAGAVRQGIRDYLFRRFGPRPRRKGARV